MHPDQKKAIELACRIISGIKIEPGQKESDVARWIRYQIKLNNAKPSFAILVASGKRSIDPHGHPTNKVINKGEHVFVDLGVKVGRYCSDITRMFTVGKSTAFYNKILGIVRTAQQLAIKKVKAGVRCCDIDKVARDYIKKRCVKICRVSRSQCPGDCFIHTTGHGIRIKVHQAPRISLKNRSRLKAGMIITIEPGIYIKGWGGVRIEDMVEVRRQGCINLTGGRKCL